MTQSIPSSLLVADRFKIVRFIAEGGMGEVYEAEDQVLKERVALKFLNRRSVGDERVMRRFRREIQLARKVTHRNVCRLHDVYVDRLAEGPLQGRSVTFVTMELLDGETLEEYLTRQGQLSEEEALPLIFQMAKALDAAHSVGVIHRDFKSSNVMLVADGEDLRAVVTDFGLARTATQENDGRTPLTGEMRIVGTADYMAPEQMYGEGTGPPADVYALGVVIFELVTGKKPYSAPNPMSLLAKRVSEPPTPPREFVPELDERWQEVILECLSNEPEDRPPTPLHVVAGLAGEDFAFGTHGSGSASRPIALVREAQDAAEAKPGRPWLGPVVALGLVALLVLTFLWLRPGEETGPTTLASFNPVQLTTSAGLEIDPSFSPDGQSIAYSSDQSGSFEIWVRDLRPGGQERQLTDDGSQNFEPAWSPDGKTLAYHSKEQGGIWLVPAEGGSASRLTRFGSRPAWSPDSGSLAFQAESSPLLSDTTSPALALSTLWLIQRDGSGRRQLTRAGQPSGGHAAPAFSADGQRIVFSTSPQREASEIWSIATDGSDLVRLSSLPAIAYDPVYAADGRSVFFSARSREVNALWQVMISPKNGQPVGEPVQIANLGLASIRQLATSPDGSKLAYAAIKTISNLYSLPVDAVTGEPTREPTALTVGTGRNNRPDFSPDGTRIAFDRWQHGSNVAVWTMDANGDNLQQVTTDPWANTQPGWLPTGEGIAFQSRQEGQRAFWQLDLPSGERELLTKLDEDVDWARLSPDGTRIAYHSRTDGPGFNVWILDLEDDSRAQLTFADEFMGFPCWSHDSQWLAFQIKIDDHSHLMVVSAEGGEPTQLTTEEGQNWPFSFSPDQDKVAFSALRGEQWHLWWVSRSSGEERRLTDSSRLNAYVRYPTWSPRGDQIVYELAETTGDIWLVETAQ